MAKWLVPCANLFFALSLILAHPAAARAQDTDLARFQARVYSSQKGGELPYGLFVPRGIDPSHKLPLILFLHGAGERGTDNRRQLRDIKAWASDEVQAKYPCFILAPQCPNWRELFQLYGHNSDMAVTTYRTYLGSEKQWKHFQIAPGRAAIGKTSWLVFFNDDRGRDSPVDSQFRNVKVYEAGQAQSAKPLDFRKLALSPYAGGGRGNNPTVEEEEGAALHLVGDTRKRVPLPYTVTKNTVLEFDFKSSAEGDVQGIGLDNDDQLTDSKWVDVDWGAASHTIPKEPSTPMRLVMELLPALQKEFPAIDPRRLYVTGLSMGGFGAWDLIARRPSWFAAAVPICGGADLDTALTVAAIPIWAFHGSQDGTVHPERSRNMIAALWNIGSEPRYTEYQGVGHDSWTKAYAEPELLPWLFAQRKVTTAPSPPAGLTAAVVGSSRVDLSWSPPPDRAGAVKEYHVLRDGGEIGASVSPRFTDTEVSEGDIHSYAVLAMNRAWLKSAPTAQVWAKMPPDGSPVHLISAEAMGSPFRVEARFDKPLDPKTASDKANYSLSRGATIIDAALLPDGKTVRLDTSQLMAGAEYELTVVHLTDRSAKRNPIETVARKRFTHLPILAAHWRMDEGEGLFSADASGNGSASNGNVITFRSVDWAPGKWGKALSFDGAAGHYGWTLQSRSLDLTDTLTVSLWVKKSAGLFGRQIIMAKSNHFDHRTQFMIELDESQRVFSTVGTLDKGEVVVAGRRLDVRDWHHIAITYGANTLELFIDGVSQGKATGGDRLMSVSEPVTFGSGHQGREAFRGALDEVRIYNRALTAAQVQALAAAEGE